MSIVQTCADVEAAIGRARSLFGDPGAAEAPGGATDIDRAAKTAAAARERTASLSGSGIDAYQSVVDRSVGLLTTGADSDRALATHMTTAAAVTQAGATRIDHIAAQTREISRAAAGATTPAGERVILAALRSQLAQASQMVQSTQQHAAVLAGHIRALHYPKDTPPSGGRDGGSGRSNDIHALDNHFKVDGGPKPPPPNPPKQPQGQPQIGPFPVPPQVAAAAPGDPPSGQGAPDGASTLAGLGRASDLAVLDAMKRVRAAQRAYDDAARDAYIHGPGSQEGQAAIEQLPTLRHNLADALDDVGKIPDYSGIDPTSVHVGPDGDLLFCYALDGQVMQVTGALHDGTGELFDQGTKGYYTYQNGTLVGTRFLDQGAAIATDEPMLTAITTAVGVGPAVKAGEAGWLGLRALFARESAESAIADITADNVLPHSLSAAEARAEIAAHDLADHAPMPHGPIDATAEHPLPLGGADHPAPPISHEPPIVGAGPHDSPLAAADIPHPLPADPVVFGPEFTFENPLDHISPDLQALSEQHLTGSGETVLGPYSPQGGGPSYIKFGEDRGASYFDIEDAWNAATPAERLAANQHVLDIAIANRDKITLSVPFRKIDPNTFTGAEIRYLESHGYQRLSTNTLVPPTEGKP